MDIAIDEARNSFGKEFVAVGSIVVLNEEVIGRGANDHQSIRWLFSFLAPSSEFSPIEPRHPTDSHI